jgi:hypothetical protein
MNVLIKSKRAKANANANSNQSPCALIPFRGFGVRASLPKAKTKEARV